MIIDTNALSAFFDAEPGAVHSFERADDIALPVIVLGEYRFGLLGSRRRRGREDVLDQIVRSSRALPFRSTIPGSPRSRASTRCRF